MISSRASLYTLRFCTTVAFLAGCSSQSQTQAPGAIPTEAIETRPAWVAPESLRHRSLIYVADNGVSLYYYDTWKQAGHIPGEADGLCVNAAQHVFIVVYFAAEIFEYAHGGTAPIRTLSDPYGPVGCSSDPLTGNLAVVSKGSSASGASVLIYPDGKGTPTQYDLVSTFQPTNTSAYDNNGNFFVDGYESSSPMLAELPKGSSSFEYFGLGMPSLGGIQWDGKYLAIGTLDSNPNIIEHFQVSSSGITYEGSTTLNRNRLSYGFFIVTFNSVTTAIVTDYPCKKSSCGYYSAKMQEYAYPHGGDPVHTVSGFDSPSLVVVSKATK